MNSNKYYFGVMALLILAILFVPFIPDDSEYCGEDGCVDSVGYVSFYTKFLK